MHDTPQPSGYLAYIILCVFRKSKRYKNDVTGYNRNVMNPILILALVVSALVAAALSAALIADSRKTREFDLPEKHDREDIVNAAARLASMPAATRDIYGDISLARR